MEILKAMEYLSDEIIKSFTINQEKEWTDKDVETVVEFYKENEFLWNGD